MSRPRCYQSADEAVITSILADSGRLIAVDGTLTCNGDGFLITDDEDSTILWDAEGQDWQSRVYCTQEARELDTGAWTPGKYKLVIERKGTNAL